MSVSGMYEGVVIHVVLAGGRIGRSFTRDMRANVWVRVENYKSPNLHRISHFNSITQLFLNSLNVYKRHVLKGLPSLYTRVILDTFSHKISAKLYLV